MLLGVFVLRESAILTSAIEKGGVVVVVVSVVVVVITVVVNPTVTFSIPENIVMATGMAINKDDRRKCIIVQYSVQFYILD